MSCVLAYFCTGAGGDRVAFSRSGQAISRRHARRGGHSEQILINSSPDGQVLGLDRDDEALGAARERLRRFDKRLIARQASFAEAFDILGEIGWQHVDGAILDLGISSHQIDSLERGFSFRSDAALDMRMDRRQSIDAREIVNSYAAEDLARIFREYGEEPQARRLARAIVEQRRKPTAPKHRRAGSFDRTNQGARPA